MTATPKFYIVKRPAGNCEILPLAEPSQRIAQLEQQNPSIIEKWGPYDSPEDAIACRIGLIRAGKCQPQWGITITFLRIAKANAISNLLASEFFISLFYSSAWICVNPLSSAVNQLSFFNRRWGQMQHRLTQII